MAQGFDGVEAGGFPGGVEAEDDADARGDRDGGGDRGDAGERRPAEECGDRQRHDPSESHAHEPAGKAEDRRLQQELPQHVAQRAPTAIRRPISRVRSVTLTSMMFMIPTPPTTSEIIDTHSSSLVIRSVVEATVLEISVQSRMRKSSGSPAGVRCRWRRSTVSCCFTFSRS